EPFLAALGIDAGMAGADEGTVGVEEHRAAIHQHVDTTFVEVRTGDLVATADADVVGAVNAAATATVVDNKIIVTVVRGDIGGFDGFVVGQGMQGRIGSDAFAGGGIEFDQFDAAPIGTEDEPEPAIGIEGDSGVDGVEIVGRSRLHHDATVSPRIVRIGG